VGERLTRLLPALRPVLDRRPPLVDLQHPVPRRRKPRAGYSPACGDNLGVRACFKLKLASVIRERRRQRRVTALCRCNACGQETVLRVVRHRTQEYPLAAIQVFRFDVGVGRGLDFRSVRLNVLRGQLAGVGLIRRWRAEECRHPRRVGQTRNREPEADKRLRMGVGDSRGDWNWRSTLRQKQRGDHGQHEVQPTVAWQMSTACVARGRANSDGVTTFPSDVGEQDPLLVPRVSRRPACHPGGRDGGLGASSMTSVVAHEDEGPRQPHAFKQIRRCRSD